jgi:hypothetical protein
MNRLPMPAVAAPYGPGRRAWPLEAENPCTGCRVSRKPLRTPFSTSVSGMRADAFAIHVIGAKQRPAAPFPLRRVVHRVERFGQDARAQAPFELARVEPAAPAFRFARERQVAAQQLGEDLRAGRAFKQHRAAVIFALRGLGQRFQVLRHLAERPFKSASPGRCAGSSARKSTASCSTMPSAACATARARSVAAFSAARTAVPSEFTT